MIRRLRGFGRSTFRHLAQDVQRRDPVCFGIRRKIEDVVDKRFDRCTAMKGQLPQVYQFRGEISGNLYPK